jgi:hypothetical protein
VYATSAYAEQNRVPPTVSLGKACAAAYLVSKSRNTAPKQYSLTCAADSFMLHLASRDTRDQMEPPSILLLPLLQQPSPHKEGLLFLTDFVALLNQQVWSCNSSPRLAADLFAWETWRRHVDLLKNPSVESRRSYQQLVGGPQRFHKFADKALLARAIKKMSDPMRKPNPCAKKNNQ